MKKAWSTLHWTEFVHQMQSRHETRLYSLRFTVSTTSDSYLVSYQYFHQLIDWKQLCGSSEIDLCLTLVIAGKFYSSFWLFLDYARAVHPLFLKRCFISGARTDYYFNVLIYKTGSWQNIFPGHMLKLSNGHYNSRLSPNTKEGPEGGVDKRSQPQVKS